MKRYEFETTLLNYLKPFSGKTPNVVWQNYKHAKKHAKEKSNTQKLKKIECKN